MGIIFVQFEIDFSTLHPTASSNLITNFDAFRNEIIHVSKKKKRNPGLRHLLNLIEQQATNDQTSTGYSFYYIKTCRMTSRFSNLITFFLLSDFQTVLALKLLLHLCPCPPSVKISEKTTTLIWQASKSEIEAEFVLHVEVK